MANQRLEPLRELRRLAEDEAHRTLGAAMAARDRADAAAEAHRARVVAACNRLSSAEASADGRSSAEMGTVIATVTATVMATVTSGRSRAEQARFLERLRLEHLDAERTWREFRTTELARARAQERAAAEAYHRCRAERESLERHAATEEQSARRLGERRSESG